jgi:hypothetical protein
MRKVLPIIVLTLILSHSFAQTSTKTGTYLDKPLVADSSEIIMIPISYHTDILSSNKITLYDNYYANIIFYNFKLDSSKKLFPNDTYIANFKSNMYNRFYDEKIQNKNISKDWILYKVKNSDRNKNGKIDSKDPSILYISDKYGNNLQQLSTQNENVIDIELYDYENFALIKFQNDLNNDLNFTSDDKEFYYLKLDLKSLTFGKKIEIK